MGIESGSVGGGLEIAGPGGGGLVGGSVESGLSMRMEIGGLTGLGRGPLGGEGIAPFSTIAPMEGPVGPSISENTMTTYAPRFNPTGEILFNPFPEEAAELPSGPEAVAGVEKMLFQAKEAPYCLPGAAYWFTGVTMPQAEPRVVAEPLRRGQVLEEAEAVAAKAWENNVITQAEEVVRAYKGLQPEAKRRVIQQVSGAVLARPDIDEQQVVMEKKRVVEQVKPEEENSEDLQEARIKMVEAGEISQERKEAIKMAIRGLEKFVGKYAVKLLSEGFWRRKSPIVGAGKDWTIDLTAQAIEADTTEYKSAAEAEKAWVQSVYQNIPVKEGEGVRRATVKEVRKVRFGGDAKSSEADAPAEIVIKRMIKKGIEAAKNNGTPVVLEEKVEVSAESNLVELNPTLAEVFQKAA